jgi:hypothetical protein
MCRAETKERPMVHRLTLDIPDEVYQPLARQARQAGRPVETVAAECLARAVSPRRPSDELLRTAGAIDADVPDLCERLDEYLGQPLNDELRGGRNG